MSVWERFGFAILVGLLQCFGVTSLILVGVWLGKYHGGFAWDGSAQQFNYHPVCMVLSMVFLPSEAMIIYRVLSHENKKLVKLLHMSIQLIAFIVAVVGLQAVFDFHNSNGIPNMYSIHSWFGIATIVLFTAQFVFGFLGFLFPRFPDALRTSYLKVHVFFGTSIFVLATGTCLTGITEKAFFAMRKTYKDLPPEAVLVNFLGATLVIAGGLAYFIVTNPKYKRVSMEEEQTRLMGDAGQEQLLEQ